MAIDPFIMDPFREGRRSGRRRDARWCGNTPRERLAPAQSRLSYRPRPRGSADRQTLRQRAAPEAPYRIFTQGGGRTGQTLRNLRSSACRRRDRNSPVHRDNRGANRL